MRFDYFDNVRNNKGELCTEQKFLEVVNSKSVTEWCKKIADEPDHKKQGTMKTDHLPVFAFVASFDNHERAVKYAHPSGLVMVDMPPVASSAFWFPVLLV